MAIGFYVKLNKLITWGCKVFKKNGAQLPGYFVYDIFKQKDILTKIKYPKFVIAVTGSSGKGTTCQIIKHILEDANLSVCYNESGNNGVLGITTLVLNNCDANGKFLHDVLLLECDEKHLKLIFTKNKPNYLVITNITRDQPARNGNPEIIFKEIMKAMDNSVHFIINADDPLVSRVKYLHNGPITTYGIAKTIDDYEKSDLNSVDFAYCPRCHQKLVYDYYHYGHLGKYHCPNHDFERGKVDFEATNVDLNNQSMLVDKMKISLNKNALYVGYATLAAYSVAKLLNITNEKIVYALNNDQIKAKRGQILYLNKRPIMMLESKNENNLSYYQSIKYITEQKGQKVVILGFENVSRRYKLNDLSWLYDVDFEQFNNDNSIAKFYCIGRFRYDVGLRLEYAKISKDKIIYVDDITNLIKLVKRTSTGDIYTMVCFDMTGIIKKEVLDENN